MSLTESRKVYKLQFAWNLKNITLEINKFITLNEYNVVNLSISNFSFHDIYDISNLPNCICELNIIFSEGVTLLGIDNLPPNLKILKLRNFKNNINFDMLPQALEVLFIHTPKYHEQFNKSLNNLPNLTTLYIDSEDFNQSLTNLPESLITLCVISNQRIYNKHNLILPNNLKYFNCNCIDYNGEMIIFPESLEYLALDINENIQYVFDYKLPDNLVKFVISNNVLLDFAKLPKNLEELIYVKNLHIFNYHLNLNEKIFRNKIPETNIPFVFKSGCIRLINHNFKIYNFEKCCCGE